MKRNVLLKVIIFSVLSFALAFALMYWVKDTGMLTESAEQTSLPKELVADFQARENYSNRESSFAYDKVDADSIIFIGDSLVQRSEWSEVLENPKVMNFGINGDTIAGVYRRLDSILERKPQAIFVLIGVNDLYLNQFSETDLINQYRQMIQKIRQEAPQSQLYTISLLPVNQSKFAHPVDNQKIISFNNQIQPIVESLGGQFINVHPQLLNQAGELDETYTYDGIHLNGTGYAIFAQKILDQVN